MSRRLRRSLVLSRVFHLGNGGLLRRLRLPWSRALRLAKHAAEESDAACDAACDGARRSAHSTGNYVEHSGQAVALRRLSVRGHLCVWLIGRGPLEKISDGRVTDRPLQERNRLGGRGRPTHLANPVLDGRREGAFLYSGRGLRFVVVQLRFHSAGVSRPI
jgi:hypothetical protein